jgi:hypothetical protein
MTTTGPSHTSADEMTSLEERVELVLPARPDLLFLARMTAAAVASRADFGYDQIEDLRLALDELCLTLLGGREEAGRLELQFSWRGDSIEVDAHLESDGASALSDSGTSPSPNELSERILDALVDEHGFDTRDGRTSSWLKMQRQRVD